MIGQEAHQLDCREWGMQEEPDRLLAAELAQALAERDKVIVVHPDEIVGVQHRRQRPGEGAVDPHVAGDVASRVADQRGPIMKKRPQHAIGEADIVFVVIPSCQVERRGGNVAVYLEGRRFARLPTRCSRTRCRRRVPGRRGGRPPARPGWAYPARSARPGWRRRPGGAQPRMTNFVAPSGRTHQRGCPPESNRLRWPSVRSLLPVVELSTGLLVPLRPGFKWPAMPAIPALRRPQGGCRPPLLRQRVLRPGWTDRRGD